MADITTGSNNTTIVAPWPCDDEQDGEPCQWSEMHHYGDEGEHYCPTGFMLCHQHGGVGTITGPAVCKRWGR